MRRGLLAARVLGVGSSCVAPPPPNEERIEWNINLCLFRKRGKGGPRRRSLRRRKGDWFMALPLLGPRGEIFFRPERDRPQFTRQREKYNFFLKKSDASRKCISHIFAFFLLFFLLDRSVFHTFSCVYVLLRLGGTRWAHKSPPASGWRRRGRRRERN